MRFGCLSPLRVSEAVVGCCCPHSSYKCDRRTKGRRCVAHGVSERAISGVCVRERACVRRSPRPSLYPPLLC